ncbi:MAG TPA: hypothetical protein VGH88_14790 [Streptosporangiaceae bacterium]|jgi:hypothetical protein
MHPFQAGQLADQRIADWRSQAAERRRLAAAAAPATPIRQWLGWILIQAGLRLAVSSVGAWPSR